MLDISIKHNLKAAERFIKRYTEGIAKAQVAALNKTGDKANTAASREVRKTYNIKASALKKALSKSRASKGRSRFVIYVDKGKRIALTEFGATQGKKGVRVKVLKQGGRKVITHAFIATMRSGHRAVYLRKGRERLPISERAGPSIGQMFVTKAGDNIGAKAIHEAYEREFPIELERALRRFAR